jgi:hypothetical protein
VLIEFCFLVVCCNLCIDVLYFGFPLLQSSYTVQADMCTLPLLPFPLSPFLFLDYGVAASFHRVNTFTDFILADPKFSSDLGISKFLFWLGDPQCGNHHVNSRIFKTVFTFNMGQFWTIMWSPPHFWAFVKLFSILCLGPKAFFLNSVLCYCTTGLCNIHINLLCHLSFHIFVLPL